MAIVPVAPYQNTKPESEVSRLWKVETLNGRARARELIGGSEPLTVARKVLRAAALSVAWLNLSMPSAFGHGFSGQRFFPATLVTDDPFVADELSLPTVSTSNNAASGDSPVTRETDVSVDVAKRITRDLGIEIGRGWRYLKPQGSPHTDGPTNIEGSIKYLLMNDPDHELLLSAGVGFEWGGTGLSRVNADRFNTFTPSVFAGKGFGDLPDSAKWLKPLAVTGTLGIGIPSRSKNATFDTDPDTGLVTVGQERNSNTLNYGVAIEYSLIYLQSFVEDVGLTAPFNRLIPLVEFNMQMPINRDTGTGGNQNIGTINPGVIWAGQDYQIGVEAMLPVNNQSGRGVGGIAQAHFFIDDLFPHSLGKPIFDTPLFGN